LPELVVTLAALRIGAVDMAIGNVLGSNMFNILVLAVDDLVYTPGSFYADISSGHLASAVVAMIMTGIVVAAVYLRPRVAFSASAAGPASRCSGCSRSTPG
jgi:cation:H+ antiporter